MSDQADTRALRALVHEYNAKRFVTRGPEVNRAHEIMAKLADAAPALLDEVDALRARVAELEREVERVRERDATVFLTGLRVIRSPWIQRGTIIVNDQEMSDAGFERAALAPRAENDK